MTNTNDLINNGDRCSLPWINAQLNLQNNTIAPCCKYIEPKKPSKTGPKESLIKMWSGAEFKKLKEDILNNQYHPACIACDVPEQAFSYRSFKNKAFINSNLVTDLDEAVLPQAINFSLKNICNLACRMCSPYSSSKLAELAKKSELLTSIYNYDGIDNGFDVESLKGSFKSAKTLTIAGGEPLVDMDCLRIIDMFREESPEMQSVIFSTNFTKPRAVIMEALQSLNCRVQFCISIDGNALVNDYIRHGAALADIIENIKTYAVNKHFVFGVNTTVSLLNAGYTPEILTTLQEIMDTTGVQFTHIMVCPVLESHMHAGNLPAAVKQLYIDKIKNFTDPIKIRGSQVLLDTALELMSEDRDGWEFSKKFLAEFDSLAHTSYEEIYPEFKD